MRLNRKQVMKIAKMTWKETMLDYAYENGNSKESIKHIYDENNKLLLGLLKTFNKKEKLENYLIEKVQNELLKENLKFTINYLFTLLKFIVLTLCFGLIFYFISRFSEKLNKFLQDYIFSIIMIIYSALLYKLVGDEFKTLFYSNYCFNYSRRKFKKKYSFVKQNIQAKEMLRNNLIMEDLKEEFKKNIEIIDERIEGWSKL